jgi:hypothetical protein
LYEAARWVEELIAEEQERVAALVLQVLNDRAIE